MKLHTITQLKAAAGEILDRALSGKPQYIVRGGAIAVISKVEVLAGVVEHPAGHFADAYVKPDAERLSLEKGMAKTKQKLER